MGLELGGRGGGLGHRLLKSGETQGPCRWRLQKRVAGGQPLGGQRSWELGEKQHMHVKRSDIGQTSPGSYEVIRGWGQRGAQSAHSKRQPLLP